MAMKLLTTNTPSGASNSAFTSKIDNTYKLYIFRWHNVNGSANDASFQFNGSIDGGSNYNVTKTATYLNTQHSEGDANPYLSYDTANDTAQGTGYQKLNHTNDGASADGSSGGELFLFNPSNTTYVKHFYSRSQFMFYDASDKYAMSPCVGGYFNTTDDIDAINFQMDSGTFSAVISMYGVG